MPRTQQRFWLVFADYDKLSATVRHPTRDAAIDEATRLAERNPGVGFLVAAVTGLAIKETVTFVNLETP